MSTSKSISARSVQGPRSNPRNPAPPSAARLFSTWLERFALAYTPWP
jgi:hypothetical protein